MSAQSQLNAWLAAVAKQQQATAMQPPPAAPEMPSDVENFAAQRRNALLTYQQTLAQNDLNRGNTQQQETNDFAANATKYNQMRDQLPGAYAHRGLLNSGIYGTALQNYATARTQATNDLTNKYQGLLNGYNLTAKQANDSYTNTSGNVAGAEQARRADLAQQIRTL